jgi:hypothetical protein
MNATYYDVAQLLEDNGFGLLGADIFGGEWGEPDKQILCLEGVGTPSDIKALYEQTSVQILVRGEKRARDHDTYTVARAVSLFLLGLSECVAVNGTDYKGFEEGSNIAPLGQDTNERFMYSMNFYTYRNRG